MGGCCSKRNALSHLDDSVKVMVRHDAKMLEKRGQTPGGYIPRAPHPLMDAGDNNGNTDASADSNGNATAPSAIEGAPRPTTPSKSQFGPGTVITE